MKYFKKNEPPQSLTQWLTDYNDVLKKRYNSDKSIDSIWSELGKALDKTTLSDLEQEEAKQRTRLINAELDAFLLKEQGCICCYCGKRIPENNDFVREHFEDKNHNRALVFRYSNLFASCEGGKIISYSIGQKIELQNGDKIEIKSIADVVTVLKQNLPNITIEDIEKHPKNKGKAFLKGDKIYFPNPPHCDTSKSDKIDEIVNPSVHEGCEYWFIYSQEENTTKIKVEPLKNIHSGLVKKTIDVLELNVNTLTSDRFRYLAFTKGNNKVIELQNETFESDEDKEAFIKDYIENEVYARTDYKLDPFCFVTASVVWHSFL
jgi:uncharacterized protein (TIGR02646 family)